MAPIRIYLDSWNGALPAQPSSPAAKARAARRKGLRGPAVAGKAARPGKPIRDSWVF